MILQFEMLDAQHQWRHTGRVCITIDFLAILAAFDHVHFFVWVNHQTFYHHTLQENEPSRSDSGWFFKI